MGNVMMGPVTWLDAGVRHALSLSIGDSNKIFNQAAETRFYSQILRSVQLLLAANSSICSITIGCTSI